MATHEPETRTPLELGRDDDGRMLTAEEFAEAYFEEPWRYERVRGRLVVMSPEGQMHDDTAEPWRVELIHYQRNVRPDLVERVKPDAWIRIAGETDRIADLAVYLRVEGNRPPIPDRVPDIVFEFVSRGSKDRKRDYVEKRADYHRLGIPEYVIVDRFKARVTVLEHRPGGYDERVLGPGDVYESPRLPGLAIDVGEVLGR